MKAPELYFVTWCPYPWRVKLSSKMMKVIMVFVDTKFLLDFSPFMLFLACEKGGRCSTHCFCIINI